MVWHETWSVRIELPNRTRLGASLLARGSAIYRADFRRSSISSFLSSDKKRLLAFAGNERIEDTYVQVCPFARDSSHVDFHDLHADDDACVYKNLYKNLSSGLRSYEPTIFSKQQCVYMRVCMWFFFFCLRRVKGIVPAGDVNWIKNRMMRQSSRASAIPLP